MKGVMHTTMSNSEPSFDRSSAAFAPAALDSLPAASTGDVQGYRMGDYEIDLACFELRYRGERRPVQPRVFDLLVYLVARRHRVVTNEELRASVWRGVRVCADSLTYSVSAARRALDDDGKTQGTIINVRGRGYRFVAPAIELRSGAR
jgi:DNA-binding winged helix-turn-helix (wHTH) protein